MTIHHTNLPPERFTEAIHQQEVRLWNLGYHFQVGPQHLLVVRTRDNATLYDIPWEVPDIAGHLQTLLLPEQNDP